MNFNILTVLLNALCVLATPIENTISLNNITDVDKQIANNHAIEVLIKDIVDNNNTTISKRAETCGGLIVIEAICVASGPKYRGQWKFCNFDCGKEPNWACENSCYSHKSCCMQTE
ncbi:hypothetical protein PIROE2DRAFT_63621 [Piromyces sp. E2]|nr:hypothetical protein PIROE2DRAFT_63621 [Piromyces sp. E2]|eukprot:OUM59657.1 hypothetical protein PIROE2DRAFT_63621 [Piromyces sp. E2]